MPITQAFDRRSQAIAASIRHDLGCPPWDPFPLDELLSALGVYTLNPSEIPGMSESSLQVLFGDGAESWAAVTSSRNEHTVVIFNPLLSEGKRRVAVTHEVAHILLMHTPSTLMFGLEGTATLHAYGLQDEAEADWLMGCLLLPTPVLDEIALGPLPESLAPFYGVTHEVTRHRLRVAGALRRAEESRDRVRALLEDPPDWG